MDARRLARFALEAMLTGLVGCTGYADPSSSPVVSVPPATQRVEPTSDEPEPPRARRVAEPRRAADCCKGKNECKGRGNCKVEGAQDCKGKNECKGQGGCKPADCCESNGECVELAP